MQVYALEGGAEVDGVLAAIRGNLHLCERIRDCIQRMLILQHKHLRSRFQQLTPQQMAISVLLTTLPHVCSLLA
jgi:hypothetical protein